MGVCEIPYTVVATPKTFDAAKAHCAETGKRLATVWSADQNEAVQRLINQTSPTGPYTALDFWIGGTDSEFEGNFMWADGYTTPTVFYQDGAAAGISYVHWEASHPFTWHPAALC